jgi:drug/metabolite transporter (DMT)-like permease
LEWGGLEATSWVDLVLLITPAAFAMCFWRSEKFAYKYPAYTQTLTGVMLTSVTVYTSLWALLQGRFPLSYTDWHIAAQTISSDRWMIPLLLFQGVIATGWTALSEQRALKVLTAAETSLIYALEPIFAAAFSFAFLHEKIGWNTLIGASLIIAACLSG